jgi:hypothetical protein
VCDILGNRMRILVDVQGDGNGLLGSAIGGSSAQVVSDRQVVEARHQTMLATDLGHAWHPVVMEGPEAPTVVRARPPRHRDR